ncbi:beta-propeller domain-containing protein, partial [Candidatus Parcubacteria bacterium]|nr:beta-propeller domain-containing protein [Candidatus Parcubacteria bacterium]
EIEKKLSFVGSSGQSIVYMTDKALYITYSYYESILKFFSQFLKEKCDDLFPSWVLEKVKKLEDYDISEQAKLLELRLILENFQNALANDERLKIRNEVFNRMSNYYKENIRKFEKSGIVKIDLEKLEIKATGNIPGFPLNQFSLDEKDDILRIAVTVGERFPFEMVFYFGVSTRETANDVYVLDKNLKILGQIQDLGLGERIYSARFIEDKGYLVTFRETDPFFVLDLSDPKNPTLKGQLKIPGYSSYLHPISKDKILGIGREDWKVKISLFDVSVPENPKELAKYILDESWSDILSTHHAFLLDTKHEIFFLPGTQGGYIFSFQNDNLVLKKAVSGISAKRAIYIDDYLYIIGENKIVVLDEIGWQKIQELEF